MIPNDPQDAWTCKIDNFSQNLISRNFRNTSTLKDIGTTEESEGHAANQSIAQMQHSTITDPEL
jgi:hypothetical protein